MKNSPELIKAGEDGSVQLCGDLTFDSTPYFYDELESRFESPGDIITVDLEEIGRLDSSGLALLLEWQAMANRSKKAVRIVNAPDILLRLAKLCEADKLLELIPRAD